MIFIFVLLDQMQELKLDNNATYEGEVNDDKRPHGFGIITYQNGTTFAGLFHNGEKEGLGVLTNSDMAIMTAYKDDKKEGHGLMIWGRGDIFNGFFTNDMPNGLGDYFWPNGDNYNGQFVDGLREGYGVLVKEGVNSYFGDYAKDKRNGVGSFTTRDGFQLTTEWVNGEVASDIYDEDGQVVTGNILEQVLFDLDKDRPTMIPKAFGIEVERRRRRKGENRNKFDLFKKVLGGENTKEVPKEAKTENGSNSTEANTEPKIQIEAKPENTTE